MSVHEHLRRVIIHGDGFAGNMVAAHLEATLEKTVEIIQIADSADTHTDTLYGTVSAPSAYDFFLTAGLDEPNLVASSEAAFSFGTYYQNWPSQTQAWMQSFHLPMPVMNSVPFHHYLTYRNKPLEPYLVSAQAAFKGVFAHPPSASNMPLSRAEYGYHFSVAGVSKLLETMLHKTRVTKLQGSVANAECQNGKITALQLASGQVLKADLYIDCSGAERRLISALGGAFKNGREIGAYLSSVKCERLGPPFRSLTAKAFGWISETPLQRSTERLTVFDPDMQDMAAEAHQVAPERHCIASIGHLDQPWIGNCVSLGHAAWVFDPLTPAPIAMLQRDIERLVELLPVSRDTSIEQREYNRRFLQDCEHVDLFHGALLDVETPPDTPYWSKAVLKDKPAKLARKFSQFKHRGLFVPYDLDLFNQEDWSILHYGMGRRPEMHDIQVEKLSLEQIDQQLSNLEHAVQTMVSKMPPHHIYMTNLKRYLEKQKYG